MKLSVFALLLPITTFLASCSKNDTDTDKGKTYITITNNFGSPLQNLTIGVLRGSTKMELVKNIGLLDQNAVSDKIEVKQKDTDFVTLFFDHFLGKTYMIHQPYGIVQGSTTNLTILSIVNTSEIQKSADLYPK